VEHRTKHTPGLVNWCAIHETTQFTLGLTKSWQRKR